MSQRRFDRDARRRAEAANRRRRRAGIAAGAVGAAVLLAPSAASAQNFVVENLNDDGSAGSLRSVVADAQNVNEPNTITFAQGLTGTITLTKGQIEIDGDHPLTIDGGGAITVSGGRTDDAAGSRIFDVTGQSPTVLKGLTLTGGSGNPGNEDSNNDFAKLIAIDPSEVGGGAVLSDGNLTITDSVVKNNTAEPDGLYVAGGGVLITGGDAVIERTLVTGNRVGDAPGDSGSGPSTASGGGIANLDGTLSVKNSQVTSNAATGSPSYGGGITAIGTTTVSDGSKVTGNTATYGAGIAGNDSALDFDEGKFGLLAARTNRDAADDPTLLTVTDSTIAKNAASEEGGGLGVSFGNREESAPIALPITLTFQSVERVTIERSTIDANTATSAGAGIASSGQEAANDVSVRESTVSNNHVESTPPTETRADAPAAAPSGTGGGIDVDRVGGPFLVSNSTVAGNSAGTGGGLNGGLQSNSAPADSDDDFDTDDGELKITNSTVAANTASTLGGGVMAGRDIDADEHVELDSSIVSGNTANGEASDLVTPAPTEEPGDTVPQVNSSDETELESTRATTATGPQFDAKYSLVQTPGSAALNTTQAQPTIVGQDPQLGALGVSHGTTATKDPAAASPAIDAGSALGLTVDQRGLARIADRSAANASDGADIGAVEVPADTTTTGTTGTSGTSGQLTSPLRPSSIPASCSRRLISLVDARVKGNKVVLSGLVGSKLYGKKVTIQTDPKGAKASGFTRTTTVKASKTGSFTATVAKPSEEEFATIRYRAKSGRAVSPELKLPQSLTAKSVKSAKGTITVEGTVRKSVLGKRHTVKLRRLVCGRYRTVGTARPDTDGNWKVTFKATKLRGVSFYRAEAIVQVRPGSKKYAKQYARAIAIKTTSQTG